MIRTVLSSLLLVQSLVAAGCSSNSVALDSALEGGADRDRTAADAPRPADGPKADRLGDAGRLEGDRPAGPDLPPPTWQKVAAPVNTQLAKVHGTSASDVWAVGGAIVHFDGQAWKVSDPRTAFGVWSASPTDVWAVNQIQRLRYSGASWKVFDTTTGALWHHVWGTGAKSVWTVGLMISAGTMKGVVGHFDGTAWSKSELPDLLESIAGSDAQNVWAVGQTVPAAAGATWRYDGTSWTSVPVNTALTLHGVWVVSPTDVWAVGEQQILHCDGKTWTAVTPTSLGKGWLVDLWGSSPTSLWAVGYSERDAVAGFGSGIIYHYDGSAWTPVVTPVIDASTPALFGIWGASASDIWVVGNNGTIFRYH